MGDPGDLHDLAGEYLQACVEALDTIPVLAPGFVGAPERAFVAAGTPAADCCPQLTVHAVPLTEGGRAPVQADVTRANWVTLVATLFRCAATSQKSGQPPTAEAQAVVAEQVNADRWALWNYVWNLWREHLLFEECGDVRNWVLNQIPPSSCVGTTLTVTVSLQGYETVFGT